MISCSKEQRRTAGRIRLLSEIASLRQQCQIATLDRLRCLITRMKSALMALMLALVRVNTAGAQTLVACACDDDTVCLSAVQMVHHAAHVEMEPDRAGNHSHYEGVAVLQIGFDERGRVTGAAALSGHPLGISHLMAAVSKWRFQPVIVKGAKKKGCGQLSIKFAMKDNAPSADVVRGP